MIKTMQSLYLKNRESAWKIFWPEGDGKAKPGYVLHHKDPMLRHSDWERYIECRPEDLVMVTASEHSKLHHGILKPKYIKHLVKNIESLESKIKNTKRIQNLECKLQKIYEKIANDKLFVELDEKLEELDALTESDECINDIQYDLLNQQRQALQRKIDNVVEKAKQEAEEKRQRKLEERIERKKESFKKLAEKMKGNQNGFKKRRGKDRGVEETSITGDEREVERS